MNQSVCFFSSYNVTDGKVPVPEQLKDKDKRADINARIAVLAAAQALDGAHDLDLSALNIIVVNREGCTSHINKVSTGIAKHQPAQGFFVRGGPQTLATYTALALGSHGAAFTFVGDQHVLPEAISTALFLTGKIANSATLLIVVARNGETNYQANSVIIQNADIAALIENEINDHLSRAYI